MRKTSIQDLPEALIFEILVRIPDLRSLAFCKCVSKVWLNLIISIIHDPHLAHRLRRWFLITKPSCECGLKFSVISNGEDDVDSDIDFLNNKSSKLSLDFLSDRYEANPCLVLATYKDLILCKLNQLYCVYNPYTKQCITLPQPPTANVNKPASYGLITHDHDDDHQNNNSYYFSVVRLVQSCEFHEKPVNWFKAEIFSSKFGKWRKVQVLCPKDCHVYNFKGDPYRPGVACNGMLYWPTLRGSSLEYLHYVFGFVGIDPIKMFNINDCCNDYYCRFIGLPNIRLCQANNNWNLGVCNGSLRFCIGISNGLLYLNENRSFGTILYGNKGGGMNVWELEDNNNNHDNNGTSSFYKWNWVHCLGYHEVLFNVLKDPFLGELMRKQENCLIFNVHAVDPNDSDILYVRIFPHIAFYNIRKGTIGIVTSIQYQIETVDSYNEYLLQHSKPEPFCGVSWTFCLSLCPTLLLPIPSE